MTHISNVIYLFSFIHTTQHNATNHRGAVNSHPGNVAFRRLVHKHRTTYFASTTRKLDKARIAKEIIAQVHALPGRFLKQDGKTAKWLEINEQKAKKKVGQAFRDITPHDERFRIGAGMLGESGGGGIWRGEDTERSSDDDDEGDDYTYDEYGPDVDGDEEGQAAAAAIAAAAAGYYPQDDVTTTAQHVASASAVAHASMGNRKRQHSFDDDDLHSDRPSTPPLPPLPAPQPPSSLRRAGTDTYTSSTGTCIHEQQCRDGLRPAAHVVGFRPTAQGTNNVQDDISLSRVDMSDMVATYNAHMQQQQPPAFPLPPGQYRRPTSHASNAEPSAKISHYDNMMKLQHKTLRLPASEFALYPDAKSAGDNDGDDAGVATIADATATAATLPSASADGQQSRRGSTESTDLEKLTMQLLVKRARTWEELYYSEREYSRSLEDRLVGLLGDRVARQQMPKRRRVGDSDALAA